MPTKSDIEPNDWLLNEGSETRDPIRGVLRQIVEALMGAEADAVCGAHWGERRRDRVNSRNGYRTRTWDTEVGTIDLAIPKLRHGTYFPGWLLDPQRRAERELTSTILETHAKGMSARRLATLLQTLGMERLSRSQLWKVTREVDGAVRSLKVTRRPGEGPGEAGEVGEEEGAEKPAAEPPDEVWTRDTPTVNRG